MNLKPIFIVLCLILTALPSLSGTGFADAGLKYAVLNNLEQKYSGSSFSATFSQISTLKVLDIEETAAGKVWFSHPGKMRWQYETPDRHEIIANGKDVWIFRPEENQVMEGSAPDFFKSGAGAAFLSDINLIRENYVIAILKEDAGLVELELTPKTCPSCPAGTDEDVATINIRVSVPDYEILKVTTINIHGDTTSFEFGKIQFTPIEPSLFDFKIPEGTSVIQMN